MEQWDSYAPSYANQPPTPVQYLLVYLIPAECVHAASHHGWHLWHSLKDDIWFFRPAFLPKQGMQLRWWCRSMQQPVLPYGSHACIPWPISDMLMASLPPYCLGAQCTRVDDHAHRAVTWQHCRVLDGVSPWPVPFPLFCSVCVVHVQMLHAL